MKTFTIKYGVDESELKEDDDTIEKLANRYLKCLQAQTRSINNVAINALEVEVTKE